MYAIFMPARHNKLKEKEELIVSEQFLDKALWRFIAGYGAVFVTLQLIDYFYWLYR